MYRSSGHEFGASPTHPSFAIPGLKVQKNDDPLRERSLRGPDRCHRTMEFPSRWSRQEIVDAAVDALVGGVDSSTLRELAGVPGNESRFVLTELVAQTSDELGIEYSPDPTGSIAFRVLARRTIAGRLNPGALTSWVTRYIGPETEEFAQPFVHLGWLYEEELLNFTTEDIDRAVISEAEAFLAGEPSK